MTGEKGVYWASSFTLLTWQGLPQVAQSCSRFSYVCFDTIWLSKVEYIELLQGQFCTHRKLVWCYFKKPQMLQSKKRCMKYSLGTLFMFPMRISYTCAHKLVGTACILLPLMNEKTCSLILTVNGFCLVIVADWGRQWKVSQLWSTDVCLFLLNLQTFHKCG